MTPAARPGRGLTLLVAALVWAFDQATKALVVRNLPLGEMWAPFPALERFFTFTHTTNTGAAFGLFPDASWLFTIIAFVVIIGIVLFYDRLPTEHLLVRVALGLQLGGALGNLTDRLTRGSVVDFFDFKVWPVFNIADSSIVLGVLILAFYLMQDERGKGASHASAETLPPTAPPSDPAL
jgi:signal peptidase II